MKDKIDFESHICDAVRWTAITQALLRNIGETHTSELETPEGRKEFWERFAEVRLAADQIECDVASVKKLFYDLY